jgi:hypothetical protein
MGQRPLPFPWAASPPGTPHTGLARPRRRTHTAWGQRVANANCDRIGRAYHAQNRAICMP